MHPSGTRGQLSRWYKLSRKAHQLIKVLVVGCEHDFHPGPLARGDGVTAHQVVGFSIGERNVSKTEQGCELLNEIELRDHGLGHLFARLLVRWLELHSFLRHAFVPYNCA